jgi:hypothetical protein
MPVLFFAFFTTVNFSTVLGDNNLSLNLISALAKVLDPDQN